MRSPAMTRPRSRFLVAMCATLALVTGTITAVNAADPSEGTVSPDSPQVTWAGKEYTAAVQPGPQSGMSGCPPAAADPDNTVCDHFFVTVDVDPTFYETQPGGLDVLISWESADDDFDMYALDENGEQVADSASGGTTEERLFIESASGTYEIQVVPFTVTESGYNGTATFQTEASEPPEVSLPAVDAQGLAFSASVPVDHQRDAAEPIIKVDSSGNIYSCGIVGTPAFDFASVSTDGGDHFHLLGEPPIGVQAFGAGGDCRIALSPEPNEDGTHNYSYVGLQPLTNFSVAASSDGGRTLRSSEIAGATIVGVDRQWGTFVDQDTVLLSYNQQVPRQIVVQASNDGGLVYGPRVPASPTNPSFPGPMNSLPAALNPNGEDAGRVAYFPYNQGSELYLSLSLDKGASWQTCKVGTAPGSPTLFVTADHDREGNLYVVYGDDVEFHTYLTTLTHEELAECDQPVTEFPEKNPGWSEPVQVDREGIRTTVFPWVTTGGDEGEPGRVAIAYYGTNTQGDPNQGSFQATWHVYINQSLNALSDDPTFAQVQATTHPFHYDSICLEGLGCSVTGGDRSLADFFAIDYNPANGQIVASYDQSSKRPGDASGVIATNASFRQIAGPSLGGGMVEPVTDRVPLRTISEDPREDSIADYSSQFDPARRIYEPAGDFLAHEIVPFVELETGEVVEDGGFTVELPIADLSTGALTQAMADTASQSLLWIFRFFDGYRSAAVSARYNPVDGFTFGYNDYVVARGEGTCPGGCNQYPGDTEIPGEVVVDDDPETPDLIRMSVPLELLVALEGPTGPKQRPDEVPAEPGDRIYDAAAFSVGNTKSPNQDLQGHLYPLDATAGMDFLVPGGDQDPGDPTDPPIDPPGDGDPGDGDPGDGGPGGEPGTGNPDEDQVSRLSGETRIETAIEVSQAGFGDDEADVVVLARADLFPDALAGTPLTTAQNGPLLLTPSDQLVANVEAEIARVLPDGGRVILLGGTAALSDAVEQALTQRGYATTRYGGSNRFETAALIADGLGNPETLLIATGADFPDAISAGAAAAASDAAVLLSDDERMPAETQEYLDAHRTTDRFAVGGPAARSAPDAVPIVGADRFATAVDVAEQFFNQPPAVGVATGAVFADGLTGGAHVAQLGGPLLLTTPTALPGVVRDYLETNAADINRAVLFGGTAAFDRGVEEEIAAAID